MGTTRCALPEGHGPLPGGAKHANAHAVAADTARAEVASLRARVAEVERDEARAQRERLREESNGADAIRIERDELAAEVARLTGERDRFALEAAANEWMAEAVRVTGRSYTDLNESAAADLLTERIVATATPEQREALRVADGRRDRLAFARVSLPILRAFPSAAESALSSALARERGLREGVEKLADRWEHEDDSARLRRTVSMRAAALRSLLGPEEGKP